MGVVLKFPRPTASVEPDEGIVSILEGLLERARNGEVQSIVAIIAGSDGHPAAEMAMCRHHAVGILGTLSVAESRIVSALETTENETSE